MEGGEEGVGVGEGGFQEGEEGEGPMLPVSMVGLLVGIVGEEGWAF